MSSFTKREFRSARVGALAFLLAFIAAPLAHAANNVGWVLVNQPPTGDYTADSAHSFNSAGGTVQVGPSGTGSYEVVFNGLAISSTAPSNVQVTAYNSTNRCASRDPDIQGTTVIAYVICYNALGALANTPFTLIYQTRSTAFGSQTDGVAFLAQESSDQTTTVSGGTVYNSTGGVTTAAKSTKTGIGSGNYTVTFGGFTELGGNIQIDGYVSSDAYGGTAQCKAVDWTASSKGTVISVQCYRDDNGAPVYSAFNVSYAFGTPVGVVPGQTTPGAYIWANDATSTTPYYPSARYLYNGFKTGAITSQKTGTGQYTVKIPGKLSYTSAVALVTATGLGNNYCNVAGWTGGTINVACYDQSQAPADTRFNLVFQSVK